MAPELDIVEVRLLADAEDPDELVLASVERALAGVRFHPDSQVQDIVIDGAAGLEQLADMAPIHAYEMHRANAGDRRGRRQCALEELHEIRPRELTRRHRKFGVLDPSPTDNVADADIVGRIQEGHGSLRSTHQASEVIGAAGITAEEAVTAQLPDVPRLGHQRRGRPPGIDGVSWIGRVVLEVRGDLVDLDWREAGDRDVETFGQLRR